METKLSVCGSDCVLCEYAKKSQCLGCSDIKGRVWWTTYISAHICPIYDCAVNKNNLENCGACAEMPCNIWQDLKDPNQTPE